MRKMKTLEGGRCRGNTGGRKREDECVCVGGMIGIPKGEGEGQEIGGSGQQHLLVFVRSQMWCAIPFSTDAVGGAMFTCRQWVAH